MEWVERPRETLSEKEIPPLPHWNCIKTVCDHYCRYSDICSLLLSAAKPGRANDTDSTIPIRGQHTHTKRDKLSVHWSDGASEHQTLSQSIDCWLSEKTICSLKTNQAFPIGKTNENVAKLSPIRHHATLEKSKRAEWSAMSQSRGFASQTGNMTRGK